jgi:hypothetical protein
MLFGHLGYSIKKNNTHFAEYYPIEMNIPYKKFNVILIEDEHVKS